VIKALIIKMFIFRICKKYLISQRYSFSTNLTVNDLKTIMRMYVMTKMELDALNIIRN